MVKTRSRLVSFAYKCGCNAIRIHWAHLNELASESPNGERSILAPRAHARFCRHFVRWSSWQMSFSHWRMLTRLQTSGRPCKSNLQYQKCRRLHICLHTRYKISTLSLLSLGLAVHDSRRYLRQTGTVSDRQTTFACGRVEFGFDLAQSELGFAPRVVITCCANCAQFHVQFLLALSLTTLLL